jgi:hypothetical protein
MSIVTTIFGILFIVAGFAGLIPGFQTSDGLLFGYFYVDQVHSIADIIIGIIAIISALRYKADRLFLQVFGILFGLLAIASLVMGGDIYVTRFNTADTVVHIVITIVFLALGFSASKEGRV